jgi:Family of unknown function (DUF6931)
MQSAANSAPALTTAGAGLRKIARPTDEICGLVTLSEAAQALLAPDLAPGDYIERLCAEGLWADAVRFLAHALPQREAVWWACLAARAALGEAPPESPAKAVAATEAWVYRPTEENRRAAMAAGDAAGNGSPARWAAIAAFWSGGSISAPDAPPVPPGEQLTAVAVAGAVQIAAVQTEPERAEEKYRRFIAQGLDIAKGGNGRLADQP